jgi:two-component system nitrate/nitrite response regulator NarL
MQIAIIGGPPIYLEALCGLLHGHDGLDVTSTATDGDQARRVLASTEPDVVIVNFCSSTDPGVLDWIRAQAPRARLVVIGVENSEPAVASLARAGVAGYLTREATGSDLVETVKRVSEGQIVCPPTIVQTLVDSFSRRAPKPAGVHEDLTDREREVVELIRHGLSNKQIAHRLQIEVTTVKSHVHSIFGKLNVTRRAEAVAMLQNAQY